MVRWLLLPLLQPWQGVGKTGWHRESEGSRLSLEICRMSRAHVTSVLRNWRPRNTGRKAGKSSAGAQRELDKSCKAYPACVGHFMFSRTFSQLLFRYTCAVQYGSPCLSGEDSHLPNLFESLGIDTKCIHGCSHSVRTIVSFQRTILQGLSADLTYVVYICHFNEGEYAMTCRNWVTASLLSDALVASCFSASWIALPWTFLYLKPFSCFDCFLTVNSRKCVIQSKEIITFMALVICGLIAI